MPDTTPIDLFDEDHVSEVEISHPGWLCAGRVTNLASGESWRFVYRSTVLKTDNSIHRDMVSWLDGAAPAALEAKVFSDSSMMFGTGELTLWES